MLRIVCGQSINAEKQERFFNQFKRITNTTSNYNPRQIISNTFIRLQAQKELGQQQDNTAKQQAYISNLAQCLPAATNTHVPLAIVRKYTREWQAHLQQISDYLLEGQGIWWSLDKEDVVFHDISGHPLPEEAGPQLHHFRSSSLSSELSNLKQCWSQCFENRVTIPIHVIRTQQAVQNCGNETSVTAALPQNSFTVTRYRYPKRNIVILQPRTGNILKENTWLQFAHNNFVIE